MANKSAQEIINLVSIFSMLFGFVILIAYWGDLTLSKKLLILLFILLFIYLILKNSPLNGRLQTNKYFTIDSTANRRSGHINGTLDKLQGFLSTLSERSQPNFFQQKTKSYTSTNNLMYTSQKVTKQQPQQIYYSQYFNKLQQPIISQQIDVTTGIRLFIPQNLNSIFEEIKKKVSPKKYFISFCQSMDDLRSPKKDQQKITLADLYHLPSSLVLNEDKKLLLEKDYEIIVLDEKYCAEVIYEFLQAGLSKILSEIQSHFRNVSQILMKSFGMKINFRLTDSHTKDFDPSRDIIIEELIQFLKCWKQKSTFPSKFQPQISMKEFTSNYYSKLEKSTQIVCKFLEFNKSDEEMSFRLYIQVLNSQFRDDKIFVRDNLSVLSEQMRKVNHIFLFHKVLNDVSFTYNRIKKFITTNPLVAIIAYFSVDFTTSFKRNNQISKSLKRFFKQKSRLTGR